MLKPKRQTYQKELKKDPLLEGVNALQHNIETNSKIYGRAIIGVLAVILVVIIVSRNMSAKSEEAQIVLNRAMVLFEQGDLDNALLEFEALYDEFGSTGSGKLSAYYLGRLYFDRREMDLAQSYMTDYVNNPEMQMLTASAYSILGKLAELDKNITSAKTHYQNAVKYSTMETDRNHHSLSLAAVHIVENESSEALNILDNIIQESNPNNPIRAKAERLKGQL